MYKYLGKILFTSCWVVFVHLAILAQDSEKTCQMVSKYIQGRARLGLIRNKNNWNNASKRMFRSYSHSRIPEFL